MSVVYENRLIPEFAPELLNTIIPGGDMEHRVIRGQAEPFSVNYHAAEFGGARLLRALYNFSHSITGVFPNDIWSFGLRLGLCDSVTLNHHRIQPLNHIAILPPGCEIEYVTPSDEQWVVLQVSSAHLERVYSEIHQSDLRLSIRGIEIREIEKDAFLDFHDEILLLFPLLKLHARNYADSQIGTVLNERITRSLARVLGRSASSTVRQSLSPGERLALHELYSHISHWKSNPTQRLCLSSVKAAHPRVLQKATCATYGVTPHRWLEIVRLNAAFCDLRFGRAGCVTDAARRWHFGHSGRFAMLYRDLFGESPRQTLAQSHSTSGGASHPDSNYGSSYHAASGSRSNGNPR